MDAVKAVFDAAAEELILRYQVKASKLQEGVQNVVKAASRGLLPLQVLYNNKRGPGYCYSAEFKRFILAKKPTPESLVTLCVLQSGAHPNSGSKSSFSGVSRDDRIRHAQWISSFGRHVMEKWPGIAKLVNAYMRNDLGHRIRDIEKIALKQDRLRNSRKLSDAIATVIATQRDTPDDGWTEYDLRYLLKYKTLDCLIALIMYLGDYAPSALKAMRTKLDAKQRELTQNIQKRCDAVLMHMTKAHYEAMLQSLDTQVTVEKKVEDTTDPSTSTEYFYDSDEDSDEKFSDEDSATTDHDEESSNEDSSEDLDEEFSNEYSVEDNDEEFSDKDSNKHPDQHFSDEKLSFTRAIVKYGENHDALWEFQDFFHKKAMRFLLLHPEYTEQLASQLGKTADCTQKLGLCAASGYGCKLATATVPFMVEWAVGKHKGKEGVYWHTGSSRKRKRRRNGD